MVPSPAEERLLSAIGKEKEKGGLGVFLISTVEMDLCLRATADAKAEAEDRVCCRSQGRKGSVTRIFCNIEWTRHAVRFPPLNPVDGPLATPPISFPLSLLHFQYLYSALISAALCLHLIHILTLAIGIVRTDSWKLLRLQLIKMKYDCLLFDLDDTLYPLSSGISTECLRNIGDYMIERLGIDPRKVPDFCYLLYKNYGTTMAGLRAIGYKFNYDDYHSFVHGRLPYEKLKPDPVLRHLLQSLPIRKVIFTNADKIHAVKVLKRLGLEDCFQGIICFETLNLQPSDSDQQSVVNGIFDIVGHFSRPNSGVELPKTPILCKPSVEAMEHALRIAGINPETTIFFDDSIRNIQSAKRVGLHTVLVGTSHRVKGADHALESIHNVKEAFPELLAENEKSDVIKHSGSVGLETSVSA
ncbi:hypothetical protein ZIOFF_003420 [Zingiber officinale]|uniref:Uncharacterized protein n=2 Tax=Zingiber officinale TaxID=94328 RepID=A0A8J5MAJ1_ZINOF|nr:hypothetical protein ZIOFF_003420 [Zingiber officinale]